jgi:hypothetical protein
MSVLYTYIYICNEAGTIPEKIVTSLNEKYAGRMHILIRNADTHMMDGWLTLQYFEKVIGPAIRQRRKELNIPVTEAAGLIADAFTGNESKEYKSLRQRWSEEINAKFVNGIPGGWSKNGQPCDKVHAIYRYLCKSGGLSNKESSLPPRLPSTTL